MTGEVTLTNSNVPTEYSYSIIITNSGGSEGASYNPTQTVEDFTITTICGDGSTTVKAPEMNDHEQESGSPMSYSETFISRNTNCPVESVSLVSGDGFVLEDNGNGDFSVTLSEQLSSIEGSYTYTAIAKAINDAATETMT